MGQVPFSFVFSGQNTLLLVDPAPYAAPTDGGIIEVAFESTGTLSFTYEQPEFQNVTGQQGSCWIAKSPTLNQYYTVNTGSSTITEVTLSGDDIEIGTSTSLPATADTDITIATINKVDYLFVISTHNQTITSFSLSATTTSLINTVNTMNSAKGAGVAVYVNPSPSSTTSTTGSRTTGSAGSVLIASVALLIMSMFASLL